MLKNVPRILSRTIACLGVLGFAQVAAAQDSTDTRALLHAALEQQATLPLLPPMLPGSPNAIDHRKADTLPRGLQQKEIRASIEATRNDKAAKGGRPDETLRSKSNSSVNASVNAAAQAAAGQARAAEAKSKAKGQGPKDKAKDKPNKP